MKFYGNLDWHRRGMARNGGGFRGLSPSNGPWMSMVLHIVLIHCIPSILAGLVGTPEASHTTEMMCWVAGKYSQCPLGPIKVLIHTGTIAIGCIIGRF